MAVKVKVCGLTRAEDVAVALEAGADALGFVFEPTSPRRLLDLELPASVGPFTQCVAVFGPCRDMVTGCALTQCTEGAPPERWIRAWRLSPGDTPESVAEAMRQGRLPEALLLDAMGPLGYGGTGTQVDWGLAAEIVAAVSMPVILAGGLDARNVADAVRRVRPYGVDASSGLETSPGIKDPEKVRAFVSAAKSALG